MTTTKLDDVCCSCSMSRLCYTLNEMININQTIRKLRK